MQLKNTSKAISFSLSCKYCVCIVNVDDYVKCKQDAFAEYKLIFCATSAILLMTITIKNFPLYNPPGRVKENQMLLYSTTAMLTILLWDNF